MYKTTGLPSSIAFEPSAGMYLMNVNNKFAILNAV
jgi:hypothetical protein